MRHRSVGLSLLAAFCLFGTVMASLSFLGLLLPGGPLEPIWRLNPEARVGLTKLGGWGIALMLVVAIACATAGIGVWTRARWGRQVAITLIALNLFSDVLNAVIRGDWRTLMGVPIGGVVIWYLLRPRVRAEFEGADRSL